MKRTPVVLRSNVRLARSLWGEISAAGIQRLKELTREYGLSIAAGDLQYFGASWYVTHAGLLRISECRGCSGIKTVVDKRLSDPVSGRWVFKATVYKNIASKGFVGYGDADPSNVSSLVHGAEMRVAETRAVNRALRKAYGIGVCSVEELGWSRHSAGASQSNPNVCSSGGNNGHRNGQPRLRDRLCLLIRQHRLDASLVKAYAADYCGTATLRDASREQVEAFINHLTKRASHDRDALLCHLNSYPRREGAAK
jgi:hypothetical protein